MAFVIKDQFGRETFVQQFDQLLFLDLNDMSWGRPLTKPPQPTPLPPVASLPAAQPALPPAYAAPPAAVALPPAVNLDHLHAGVGSTSPAAPPVVHHGRPSLYGKPGTTTGRPSLAGRPSFTLGMDLPNVDVGPAGPSKESALIFQEARVSFDLSKKSSKVLEKADLKKVEIEEHVEPFEEVLQKYGVSVNTKEPIKSKGLDEEEIPARVQKYGRNILTPPKKKTALQMFVEEFENFFALLLLVAGILCFVIYGLEPTYQNAILGAVLFFVTFLNATIGFVQNFKSAKLMEELQNMLPQSTTVIRRGVLAVLPAAELVPGDVVKLKEGDKVPADVLIFHANEMKVDNSSLTGEAEPQERSNVAGHKNPLEAANLAFYGTLVVNGECYGIVIRTGDSTVLGQIATIAGGDSNREVPLLKEIESLVIRIGILAIVLGVAFFIAGNAMGYPIVQNFIFMIGIIVANVPQGIPATVSLCLTITARKLATENVLVKSLPAIETLGSVSLLASDKTGTLTMNKMTVVNIWTSCEYQEAKNFNLDFPGARDLIDICFMCSRAKFEDTPENYELPPQERRVIGDATETALLKFSIQQVPQIPEFPMVFSIPFNSENKWHMSIHHKPHDTGIYTLYIKGAPERILGKCTHIFVKGQIVPMTEEYKKGFDVAYEKFASGGQRVLAFAMAHLPSSQYGPDYVFTKEPPTFPAGGYVFMGIFGIIDPPKPGVPEAIETCTTAGIQVMMITGDHPLTAEAIAREVNIIRGKTRNQVAKERGVDESEVKEGEYDAIVIHGDKIDALTDRQWYNILRLRQVVFARTSPKHKLEIVLRCQAIGHIVGMTGDGVNDSPALKRADLGISMGISGSDVSKEAAAMILLDDNFPSIVKGITQGRAIFESLKKSICYTLTHLVPEMVPFILYIAIGIPIGISPLLVLFIDLGTEILPGIMYAFEPGESDIMYLPPRKSGMVFIPEGDDTIHALASEDKKEKKEREEAKKTEKKSMFSGWFSKKADDGEMKPVKGHIETLVDMNLLLWAYLNTGAIEAVACMFQFYAVFWEHGIRPSGLNDINQDHFTGENDDDDFTYDGKVFTGKDQKRILREAQASFFLCVVMMQLMNMYISKSRRVTFKWYMFTNNRWTTYAAIYASALALFLIYTPGIQDILSTAEIGGYSYLWPLPFMGFMFVYDYGRKWLYHRLSPQYKGYIYW